MKGGSIRKQPGQLVQMMTNWQWRNDRQSLSSECIMLPPQLQVDANVALCWDISVARGHLDVSLSPGLISGMRTTATAGQAGNQPGRLPSQTNLSVLVLSVSQATDLAGHRLRAAIDDTLTGHYRHTCKPLILIATDPHNVLVACSCSSSSSVSYSSYFSSCCSSYFKCVFRVPACEEQLRHILHICGSLFGCR